MFSKQPQPQDQPQPPKPTITESLGQSEKKLESALAETQKPEIVVIVEKLSGILSPYFTVLVGLYLYDNDSWFSFLLGTVLIITGIVSILKISGEDWDRLANWVKKTLGYDETDSEA